MCCSKSLKMVVRMSLVVGVGGWGGEGGIVLNSQTLTLSLPHKALKEFKGIDRTF